MRNKAGPTWNFCRFLLQNLASVVTIFGAILALLLVQFGLISSSVLSSITVSLLALIAISHLIDSRRTIDSLTNQIQELTQYVKDRDRLVKVQRFESTADAIEYLTKLTKSAQFSVRQASIDKQRARPIDARNVYEKARIDLIKADRVKYRYLGIVDDKRHLRTILDLLDQGPLHNFFFAFQVRPDADMPLMSFTVFDDAELFTRAPYEAGEDPVYLAIKSRDVALLFNAYFDSLWLHAHKVDDAESLRTMLSNFET